jgi:cyclin-dependent kinase 8/11
MIRGKIRKLTREGQEQEQEQQEE